MVQLCTPATWSSVLATLGGAKLSEEFKATTYKKKKKRLPK